MAKSAAMDHFMAEHMKGMKEKREGGKAKAKTTNYSAKRAAAGQDIGKPGKNFAKIAEKSGGGEKGARIAGAVLKRLRAKG